MRISDWSSDVCSSDLPATTAAARRCSRRSRPPSGQAARPFPARHYNLTLRGTDPFPHPASQRQYPEWEARWESGPVPPLFRQNRNRLNKATPTRDERQRVVRGRRVSVRVELGGRGHIEIQTENSNHKQ